MTDLERLEAAIIDWKRRAKKYKADGLEIPKHIRDRLRRLKEDARLLRQHQEERRQ